MQGFKNLLNKERNLLAPASKNSKLIKLTETALDKYTVSKKQSFVPKVIWGEERYQLLQSAIFRDLNVNEQLKVYEYLSKQNLSLSWYIERSGHNYGAKMILLSETQEEKSLYALFAAEEAIHQREFENFMDFTPNPEVNWHPLLDPLSKAISEADKQTCLFVIQVLLEGFGMSFYEGLKQTCKIPEMKEVYQRIIADEARHHGSGIVLSEEMKPSNEVKDQVFEYSREFINALKAADWIKNAVHETRPLSTKEGKSLYEDIAYLDRMNSRLDKLKMMLMKVDNWDLVKRLEKDQIFEYSL